MAMTASPLPALHKLPAARKDAEAFKLACRWLQRFLGSGTPWSNESGFSPAASDAFKRHMLRGLIRSPAIPNRLRMLGFARAGDADAIAVAAEFMNELASAHTPLLLEFQAFDMEMRAGLIVARMPQGRRKQLFVRDLAIRITVAAVVDRFGLRHSRRRKTRGDERGQPSPWRSASAVVGDALRHVSGGKIDLGEALIERIYERYRGALPTVPGWSAWLDEEST
jgi:hypothetical protein